MTSSAPIFGNLPEANTDMVMHDDQFLRLLDPIATKDIERATGEPNAFRHGYPMDQPLEIEQPHQAANGVSEDDLVTPHQKSQADMMSLFDESDHSAAAELELPTYQLPIRGAQPGPIVVDDGEVSNMSGHYLSDAQEVAVDQASLGRGMANPLHPLQVAQRRPEITQFVVGQDFEISAGRFQFDSDHDGADFASQGPQLLNFKRGDFKDASDGYMNGTASRQSLLTGDQRQQLSVSGWKVDDPADQVHMLHPSQYNN